MVFRATPTLGTLDRKTQDEDLLEEWKKAVGFEKDKKLEELLSRLSGPVYNAVNTYRGAPVPFNVLELEARRLATQALRDWDKSRGASLATHVGNYVRQRIYRYVTTHQNTARIPEHQARDIGAYQRAVTDLTSRYGTEPSTTQLADYLHMPVNHVTRIRRSLRQDLLESGSDDHVLDDYTQDPEYERVSLAYFSMSEQEKTVYDYLLGAHGQPRLSPKQTATRLKISPARVTQIKNNIAEKLRPYLV